MRIVDAATHPTAARRTRRRWVGPAPLVLAATALLGVHTWFFKPLRIDGFYARTFAQFALDPQDAALTRASFATLLRYDRGGLDREAQLAYDTLDYVLGMQLEGAELRQRGTPPDDPAYYAWCVRWHTATELTPNQAHELGVAEVERLEADIAAVTNRRAPVHADATGAQQIRRVSWGGSALPTPLAEAAAGAQRIERRWTREQAHAYQLALDAGAGSGVGSTWLHSRACSRPQRRETAHTPICSRCPRKRSCAPLPTCAAFTRRAQSPAVAQRARCRAAKRRIFVMRSAAKRWALPTSCSAAALPGC